MAVFKEISAENIKTSRSFLTQLVDVVEEDISGSTTRRKYPMWVTGGAGPGVTSSLFSTVYDQDFSLQTANPIFDITVGLHPTGSTVISSKIGEDSAGKFLFPSSSLMMREKVDIYQQFALDLLGDASGRFVSPFDSGNDGDVIQDAMFVCFRRLFHRDGIKRETFAMRFYQSASRGDVGHGPLVTGGITPNGANLNETSVSGSAIFTDAGSSTNKFNSQGGQVSEIVDSANTNRKVGLMFNDRGVAVFDIRKILSSSQHVSGVISAVIATSDGAPAAGKHIIGGRKSENRKAKFVPDFMVSASIDDITDHLCSARFQSGSLTAMAFQNLTNINSTLIFCEMSPDEFNYSSNPTYIDSNNRIVVIDEGQEDTQKSFTFITAIGLYDAQDNLLAVGKFSRPIEKNSEKLLSARLRLDY